MADRGAIRLHRRVAGLLLVFALLFAAFAAQGPDAVVEAQDPFEPAEVASRNPVDGGPLDLGARRPAISSLGHRIAWSTLATEAGGPEIGFRNRPAGITGPVPGIAGDLVALSDNGCIIGYVVDGIRINELVRYDSCAGTDPERIAITLGGPSFEWRPALSADGNTIAWSRHTDLLIWRPDVNDVVVVSPPGEGWLIGDVALSRNGNVVAFVSGPASGDFIDGSQANIWLADVPAGTTNPAPFVVSRTADGDLNLVFGPTISSNGTLIAFERFGAVWVADRNTGVAVEVVRDGVRPALSRDGRYVTFEIWEGETNIDVYVVSSQDRWATRSDAELVSYGRPGGTASHAEFDPVVSEHGRWVAWQTYDAFNFVDDPRFEDPGFPENHAVIVRQRRPVLTVESLDFGAWAASRVATALGGRAGIPPAGEWPGRDRA